MRDPRLTERRNPRTAAIDTATSLEIVDLMSAEDAAVPAAVHRAREPIARTIDLIEAAFRAGGRLFYVGAGTSGRLGVLDASECPPTFGSEPEMVQGIIAGGLPALVKSIEGAAHDLDAFQHPDRGIQRLPGFDQHRAAEDPAGGAYRGLAP